MKATACSRLHAAIRVIVEGIGEGELRRLMGGAALAETSSRGDPLEVHWQLSTKQLAHCDLTSHIELLCSAVPDGWLAMLHKNAIVKEAWIHIFFEGWGGGGPIFLPQDLGALQVQGVPVLVDFYYLRAE